MTNSGIRTHKANAAQSSPLFNLHDQDGNFKLVACRSQAQTPYEDIHRLLDLSFSTCQMRRAETALPEMPPERMAVPGL